MRPVLSLYRRPPPEVPTMDTKDIDVEASSTPVDRRHSKDKDDGAAAIAPSSSYYSNNGTASVTGQSEQVGRAHLADVVPPHDSYEGRHRFDPGATWTPAEERRVVRKTDLCLLGWLCLMFFGLQLDRGNNSNATADDLLPDLGMTSDDYNNGVYKPVHM